MTRHLRDLDRIRRNPGMGWPADDEQAAWGDYQARLRDDGDPLMWLGSAPPANSWRSGIGEPREDEARSGQMLALALITAGGFWLGVIITLLFVWLL